MADDELGPGFELNHHYKQLVSMQTLRQRLERSANDKFIPVGRILEPNLKLVEYHGVCCRCECQGLAKLLRLLITRACRRVYSCV